AGRAVPRPGPVLSGISSSRIPVEPDRQLWSGWRGSGLAATGRRVSDSDHPGGHGMTTRHIPGRAHVSTRRSPRGAGRFGTIAAGFGHASLSQVLVQTPVSSERLDHLVIDLPGVPESIDPALAYSARDWSIVHSLYDAPVTYMPDGTIAPLAAKSFEMVDT